MAANSTIRATVDAMDAAAAVAGDPLRFSWQAGFLWAQKAGTAALDQASFAGTHFVVNVLLARWLLPADYGAFAVAYSLYLLLDAVYHALVSEPMLTFGAAEYRNDFRLYLGGLLKLHLGVTLAGSLVIALTSALVEQAQPALADALLGAALAAPFILLLWLSRRAQYVRLHPGRACAGAGLYFLLVLSSVLALGLVGQLSAFRALLAMGAIAAMVSLILLAGLRPALKSEERLSLAGIVRRHWSYGRWILGSLVLSSVAMNCYYFFLPLGWGLEASAALRALMNLTNPGIHLLVGITSLLIPAFATIERERGLLKLAATVRRALVFLLPVALVLLGMLWLVRFQLIAVLYGGSYRDYASWPLLLVASALVPATISTIIGCALRAIERTDAVFWGFFAGVATALAIGLPLAAAYGVVGAAAGILISQTVTSLCLWMRYRECAGTRGKYA